MKIFPPGLADPGTVHAINVMQRLLCFEWETYRKLDSNTRQRARKAYRLWAADSFHPSLRFKCINHEEDIWSVRITL